MVFDIYTLVEAVWIILPAYAANGLMPLSKGSRYIDAGRTFRGAPLFGKGKTWEGMLVAMLVGMVIGTVEMFAQPFLPWAMSPEPLVIVPMGPILGLLLGLGAALGDLGGAFIKRRIGLARGRPAPILDQEDFLVGAFLLASLVVSIQLSWFILLAVLTPVLHLVANIIAFLLKVKKEPW